METKDILEKEKEGKKKEKQEQEEVDEAIAKEIRKFINFAVKTKNQVLLGTAYARFQTLYQDLLTGTSLLVDTLLWVKFGVALFRECNRPDWAIKVYRHALALDPKSRLAREELVLALICERGEQGANLREVKKVLDELEAESSGKISPSMLVARACLAEIADDLPAAQQFLQRALEACPNDPDKIAYLRAVYRKWGERNRKV